MGQPSLSRPEDRPAPSGARSPEFDQRTGIAVSKGLERFRRFRFSVQQRFYQLVGIAIGKKIQDNYQRKHPTAIVERSLGRIADRLQVPRPAHPRSRPDIFDPASGAVYEIKPAGWEPIGQEEAQWYIDTMKPNIAAHLGQTGGLEAWGANGRIQAGLFAIDFQTEREGVISYTVSLSPQGLGVLATMSATQVIQAIENATVTFAAFP